MRTWLAATLVFLLTQPGPARQGPDKGAPVEPIARMKAWFAAVERHEPGRADAPAVEIAAWSPTALHELSADLVIFLGRIDGAHLFKPRARPAPRPSSPRPRPVVYAIRALAEELVHGTAGQVRGTGPEVSNEFLKRAALLHADVAMLVPRVDSQASQAGPSADPQPDPGRKSSDPIVVDTDDGVALDLQRPTLHWQLGRTVLSAVAPDPAQDETVRLWYRASVAYLQAQERFGDCHLHLTPALKAIPGDERLLFYAGAMHEAYASGSLQAAAHSMTSRGLRSVVRSIDDELEEAERFFREALATDPAFAEARLHLGRVVGLRGRHKEAASELRQAITQPTDPQLVYYRELFLGRQEASMRNRQAAREHFERAAGLYPRAQSPQLALGLLARTHGDRPAALQSLRNVIGLPPGEEEREDPWWEYFLSHVRNVDALLDELRRPFATRSKR
jgi:tetratricopeptide (TPR) repeat protein